MDFTNFQLFDEIAKTLLLLIEDRHQRFIQRKTLTLQSLNFSALVTNNVIIGINIGLDTLGAKCMSTLD